MKRFISKVKSFKNDHLFTYILMCLCSPLLAIIVAVPIYYVTESIFLYCYLEFLIPGIFMYNFVT